MSWSGHQLLVNGRTFLSYAIRGGCFAHFFVSNVYEVKETSGESMLPTLNTHRDYVHTLKYLKNGQGVTLGDVIVAAKPTDPDMKVCKRITGMPGDVIILDPSNDSLVADKIGKNDASFDQYITVPEGHVWATGDNLTHSLDSRTYSVIPMGLIRGKIIAAQDLNYPLSTFWGFRWIENNTTDLNITGSNLQ